MKIFIAAATYSEILPLLNKLKFRKKHDLFFSTYNYDKSEIDILISGVGMTSTGFFLGNIFAKKKYDVALNLGIAGSFKKSLKIGTVVNVMADAISEMGAENGDAFLKFDDLKMSKATMNRSAYYVENNMCIKSNVIIALPEVKGITVNTVHGNKASIERIKKLFSPEIETMEGAAFMFACHDQKIRYAQIRAVSNFVEERNLENWNANLAIENLNETAFRIISSLP